MGETCYEFVRRVWGSCTDEQADTLLWSCTAFPCCDVPHLEKQLLDIKEKSGGDFEKAWRIAEKETNEAMKDLPEQPKEEGDE